MTIEILVGCDFIIEEIRQVFGDAVNIIIIIAVFRA